jgi:hypothetical protein
MRLERAKKSIPGRSRYLFMQSLFPALKMEDELPAMTQDQIKDIAHMMRVSATRLLRFLENLLE